MRGISSSSCSLILPRSVFIVSFCFTGGLDSEIYFLKRSSLNQSRKEHWVQLVDKVGYTGIAEASPVSRQRLTALSRVRFQRRPYLIFGGQIGTGKCYLNVSPSGLSCHKGDGHWARQRPQFPRDSRPPAPS